MYPERESNPHGRYGHRILSPACLPIPPSGRNLKPRADNKIRTCDLNLGKVALYQLSYIREFLKSLFLKECKYKTIPDPKKLL